MISELSSPPSAYGTFQLGFDAEWRTIQLLTVENNRINRCELFDEADMDAALARFEELHPQPRRGKRGNPSGPSVFGPTFEARDWDAMAETWAEDYCTPRSPSGCQHRFLTRSCRPSHEHARSGRSRIRTHLRSTVIRDP